MSRTEVAEWEEPRHSGRLVRPPYPTFSHHATQFPTLPSDGRAVASRRAEYFLFTKCGHPGGFGTADWRPASLLTSIQLAKPGRRGNPTLPGLSTRTPATSRSVGSCV